MPCLSDCSAGARLPIFLGSSAVELGSGTRRMRESNTRGPCGEAWDTGPGDERASDGRGGSCGIAWQA